MSPRRIFMVILLGLLIIGLLSIGGFAGWSRGYMMGYLAAGGEGGGLSPYPGYGIGFSPFFFGLGLFFKFVLFLFFFLLIGKFLLFWLWRRAGGPGGHGWAGHRHFKPPWSAGTAGAPGGEGQETLAEEEVEPAAESNYAEPMI